MKSYKLIYVILILTCLSLTSCTSVEDRIKEYSYTQEWYYTEAMRYQVYKTKSGRKYIIVLNNRQTNFKRKYIK